VLISVQSDIFPFSANALSPSSEPRRHGRGVTRMDAPPLASARTYLPPPPARGAPSPVWEIIKCFQPTVVQNGIPKNCQCFAPPRVPSEGELNPILNDGVSLICGRLIFHPNGSSTANLWAHLKHRHPDTFVTLHPAAGKP
jgi:hypothetical protein